MDKNSSSEADSHSAGKEIPPPFMKYKINYRVHKSPPLEPILSQMHPVHFFHLISVRYILISFSHLHLGLPSRLVPTSFPV
jgi:hypothetical protein